MEQVLPEISEGDVGGFGFVLIEEHDDPLLAMSWGEFEMGDFTSLKFAIDDGLFREMQAEGDIPTLRGPRGEEVDA